MKKPFASRNSDTDAMWASKVTRHCTPFTGKSYDIHWIQSMSCSRICCQKKQDDGSLIQQYHDGTPITYICGDTDNNISMAGSVLVQKVGRTWSDKTATLADWKNSRNLSKSLMSRKQTPCGEWKKEYPIIPGLQLDRCLWLQPTRHLHNTKYTLGSRSLSFNQLEYCTLRWTTNWTVCRGSYC